MRLQPLLRTAADLKFVAAAKNSMLDLRLDHVLNQASQTMLQHLWAPWRSNYIESNEPREKSDRFLQIGASSDDEANFVLFRSRAAFVLLNKFPYNLGHLMVVPYRMVADLHELSADEKQDLWEVVEKMIALLRQVFAPHGLNIGINLGAAAGAGLPDHLHIHIVPRWRGDSNFMTITAETRVHPSDLPQVYAKLRGALNTSTGASS